MSNIFELITTSGKARRGTINTPHGSVQTPAFMNVATCGAIKGGLSALDLDTVGCQVQLCNTYHLHLRPGDEVIKKYGGLQKFTVWKKPILTDSGGFQVFSLAQLRNIKEEGVTFASHIDGRKIFMGPEESMQIQSNLGSTIAMAFDECIENPAEYKYVKDSCDRTFRWLVRCSVKLKELNQKDDTVNPQQMLWGINQGSIYSDLRIDHMKRIRDLDLPGYAIGGLAVGESTEKMYEVIETVEPYMPENKPRYLMGVGTPANIMESVKRGIDIFDCVMPTRNARHGHVFTMSGIRNLMNSKYILDDNPIEEGCQCQTCRNFTRGYLHHLFKSKEVLGLRLAVQHNLHFYNNLMHQIRDAIERDSYDEFLENHLENVSNRI